MYVDNPDDFENLNDSIKESVTITRQRRKLQMEHNNKYNITPQTVVRTLKERKIDKKKYKKKDLVKLPRDELNILIQDLESDMKNAAAELDFEKAAELRDHLIELKGLVKKK